jgi:CheY-like chemotaxis protein
MSDHALILVVEDNEDHVFLLRHAFQKAKVPNPIQVVSTGEDALAYLAGTGRYSDWSKFPLPAVVLLDLKLPGLDGFDVLNWIRQQPGLKGLRVVMLTSSELVKEVNLAHELGVNSFLVKPVDLDKLAGMVQLFRTYWLEFDRPPELSRAPAPQGWKPSWLRSSPHMAS